MRKKATFTGEVKRQTGHHIILQCVRSHNSRERLYKWQFHHISECNLPRKIKADFFERNILSIFVSFHIVMKINISVPRPNYGRKY